MLKEEFLEKEIVSSELLYDYGDISRWVAKENCGIVFKAILHTDRSDREIVERQRLNVDGSVEVFFV